MNRSYEPYSDDPDYILGNRAFIQGLDLRGRERLLDLACGIGTLGRLALESNPDLSIVGLDLSYEGLRIHRGRFHAFVEQQSPGSAMPALMNASADAIPLESDSVDAVVMGHSIHMLPDEPKLLKEIARVLRAGGLFAFNSSFYAGTFVEGTEHIYHDWTKLALDYIRSKDREIRSGGGKGIRRTRGRAPAAFSKPWLSSSDWEILLAEHGFESVRWSERTVPLTQRSFETIGAYAGFAEVILSGYPVDVACEALEVAAGRTFAQEGIEEVPRRWLEFTALRREKTTNPRDRDAEHRETAMGMANGSS